MIARRLKQMQKLAKVLANSSYRAALRSAGVAAGIEHEAMLRTLDFTTVVDIGANRGQFALVARHCYPKARIWSFEPLPGPANCFRKALGGDPLITLHPVAVGPAAGRATMHVTADDDSSSLLPVTPTLRSLSAGSREVANETIQVEPLSERITAANLKAPALLKIDVQGYELAVLQGCEALLDHFSHVYVECSFVELYAGQALASDVIRYLLERQFNLVGAYNLYYDRRGRAIQADLMFSLNSSSH
jgi:FkbM family methyltransferase